MDERKKRQRPSKAEKSKRVQRPQRVESESRFDDLLKELRTPEIRIPPAPKLTKNTPVTDAKDCDRGVDVQPVESGMLDAADRPKKIPGKSNDPNYSRITLYMRKDIHRKLKTKSTALDLELSEVLERLVIDWLAIDDIDDPFLKHFSVPRSEERR